MSETWMHKNKGREGGEMRGRKEGRGGGRKRGKQAGWLAGWLPTIGLDWEVSQWLSSI